MDNLKNIQDITGLTSEAIFNIRKPVDYMCSDIDSHIIGDMIGSKRLIRDAQAIRLVLIMNMVMIILKTEKDA